MAYEEFNTQTTDKLKAMGLYDNPNYTYGKTPPTGGTTSGAPNSDLPASTTGIVQPPKPEYKDPDISTATGAVDYYKKLYELEKQNADKINTQLETEKANFESEKKNQPWYKRTQSGDFDVETRRTELYNEYGFNPKNYLAENEADISELGKLNEDYNSFVAQRDQQIANMYGRSGIGMDFLDNSVAQINRNAAVVLNQKAANINSKAAIMEAKNNRFNQAMDLVGEAIKDFTATMDTEYKLYQDFETDNKELLDSLDEKYKTAFEASKKAIEGLIATTTQEKQQVGDLMLKYPNSGITINDTVESATRKASAWKANNPKGSGTSQLNNGIVNIDFENYSLPINTNNINSQTIDSMRKNGMNDADIYSWLDSNTDLTASSIDGLLSAGGSISSQTESVLKQYKDAGYTREEIETQWLSENKATTLSPVVKKVLDGLFPQSITTPKKEWWEFWK